MRIIRHRQFVKSYEKLSPNLQKKTRENLLLFSIEPLHPSLRNHALKGVYLGCCSIDITGDLRVIFRELSDERYEIIELLRVGTHSQLY